MKCGLLGRKLGHSYSPAIHGLFADYEYRLYEKEPEEVEDFVRNGPWDGLNVTIPYKKTAAELCDDLSPLAKSLGSVNTLLRRPDGTIWGDNTDFWGFRTMALGLPVDYRGKQALVLGSGGASVTAQAVLKDLGCLVAVISRQGEHTYADLPKFRDAAIVVNTTPVGMYPDNGKSPVCLDDLPGLEAVLDVVYNPCRTRLILDAQNRQIPCASGLSMLVGQAARAKEIWTGEPVSPETLLAVENKIRRQMENIVLIGMPGSGKTTLGKALAKELGRTFVDTDQVLTEKLGDIPAFFQTHGEEAFRREETAVLEGLGKESSLVLATGGGCVTRSENRDLLRQNGRVIWVRRDLDKLPTKGRPLSQSRGVSALYEERKPLYENFCHEAVDNNGSLEESFQTLLKGEAL